MRPTVDNVYSRRSSLYPKTLVLRVYLLRGMSVAPEDIGCFDFQSPYYEFSISILYYA